MKKLILTAGAATVAFASLTSAYAGASININSGVTTASGAWGGTPTIAIQANPTLGNSDESVAAAVGIVSEIFKPNSSFNLGQLVFFGNSGNLTVTLNLALYDLGTSGPFDNTYTITGGNVNLFTGGLSVTANLGTSTGSSIELSFSGADQVSLVAGHYYALEMANTAATPIFVRRGPNNYVDGDLKLDQTSSGTRGNVPAGQRDGDMAVYAAVPEPSTMALLGLGGLAMTFMIRRRKS